MTSYRDVVTTLTRTKNYNTGFSDATHEALSPQSKKTSGVYANKTSMQTQLSDNRLCYVESDVGATERKPRGKLDE